MNKHRQVKEIMFELSLEGEKEIDYHELQKLSQPFLNRMLMKIQALKSEKLKVGK